MQEADKNGDEKKIENINMLLENIFYKQTIYGQYVFRGESQKYPKPLLPSLGRHTSLMSASIPNIEKSLLLNLNNKWVNYTNERHLYLLEELALAQHHGFPTRLLDWTFNPMVALFFCVNKNEDSDGVFYICRMDDSDFLRLAEKKISDPFDSKFYIEQDAFFVELTHISKRITAQSGLFSIQENPEISFSETEFWRSQYTKRFIISCECKKDIKRQLALIGYNDHCLLQDFDSLCNTVFENCSIRLTSKSKPPPF